MAGQRRMAATLVVWRADSRSGACSLACWQPSTMREGLAHDTSLTMTDPRVLDAIAKHTRRCERLLFPENLGDGFLWKDARIDRRNYPPWAYSSDSIEDKGSPDFLFHPDAFKKTRCRDEGRCRKPLHECPFLHLGEVFDPSWRYAGVIINAKLMLPNTIPYDLFKFLVMDYHTVARGKCTSTLHEMRSQRDRCDKYHDEKDQRHPVRYDVAEDDWVPYPAGASKTSFERNFHPSCYKVRLCPKVEKGKPCRHDRHCTSYHSEEERLAVVSYWLRLKEELLGHGPVHEHHDAIYPLLSNPTLCAWPMAPLTAPTYNGSSRGGVPGALRTDSDNRPPRLSSAVNGSLSASAMNISSKTVGKLPKLKRDVIKTTTKKSGLWVEGGQPQESTTTSTSSFSDEELDEMMRSCSPFSNMARSNLDKADGCAVLPCNSNLPPFCTSQMYFPAGSLWNCMQGTDSDWSLAFDPAHLFPVTSLKQLSPANQTLAFNQNPEIYNVGPEKRSCTVGYGKLSTFSFTDHGSKLSTSNDAAGWDSLGWPRLVKVNSWSVDDVCNWAAAHCSAAVQESAEIFRRNDIDGCVLGTVTEHDLKEMGLSTLGRRRRVMLAIDGLMGR